VVTVWDADLNTNATQAETVWVQVSSASDTNGFALLLTETGNDTGSSSSAASPALGQKQKDPTHTANFGVKLEEKMRSLGVECHLMYPGAPEAKYPNPVEFLIAKLKAPKASTVKWRFLTTDYPAASGP